ncbi:DUF1992 domain-containing protein [Bacillus aerius]|uniref:DnaJ family domain-containing protein n=1 Tax=Bacillus aerius TaxID=293388 RepID=UPI002814F34B|nr:DUF1992 domain-containing protein [Bacillus aerius]WMT28510.1 DUF1992 domain-containing protein [Bacillus aerius]
MDFVQRLSEERIKKAMDNGVFERLSDFGKPLPKDAAAHVPEELRMGYRIMKNAGFSGEETALKKELMTVKELLKTSRDGKERKKLSLVCEEKQKRLDELTTKRQTFARPSSSFYKNRVYEKLTEHKKR